MTDDIAARTRKGSLVMAFLLESYAAHASFEEHKYPVIMSVSNLYSGKPSNLFNAELDMEELLEALDNPGNLE